MGAASVAAGDYHQDHPVQLEGEELVATFFNSSVPCALIDERGSVSRASVAFSALVPNALGREISEIFSISMSEVKASSRSQKPCTLYGTYKQPSGMLSPVAAHFFPLPRESTSLLIADRGEEFREAETTRLSYAPYPILRLNYDGRIAFANQAAHQMLAPDSTSLIGSEFGTLLDTQSRPRAAAALSAALQNRPVQPLDVRLAARRAAGSSYTLMFMPDLGPGDRMLGAMAVLQPRGLGGVRDTIRAIALRDASWRVRLKDVLSIIRDIVPFDQATFGIYAEDVTLFRAVHVESGLINPWPTLWIKLPPGIREWLEGEATWAEDLVKFTQQFEGLDADVVTRLHVDAGFRSFVTLPVIGPKGTTSSLSFASKRPASYGSAELAILKDLDLGELLLHFEREIAEERSEFVRELTASIREAPDFVTSAKIVVEKLRSFFQWDHVAIYLIDHIHGRFRLLEQSFTEGCGLPPDYLQSLDVGMLGYTLAVNSGRFTGQPVALTLDDMISAPSKYEYLPVNTSLKSALTLPVRLNKEWRWVLDFEARVTNAFHGPDVEAVREVVAQLEGDLERLYQSGLNELLLRTSPEGVVVVGSSGTILTANRAARRLLGSADEETRLGRLLDYADENDSNARAVFVGELADTSRRLQMRDRKGRVHAVLANRCDLAEEYQSSVWFFTDLDNINWNISYRYLREVVNDVAQQTRGPLMLASNHLKASTQQQGREMRPIISKALTEIGKADITFERLAEGLEVIEHPVRYKVRVDLSECLRSIYRDLPNRDQQHIALQLASANAFVSGDVTRLRYALRSIIGYLLRCRPVYESCDAKILVNLSAQDEGLRIVMAVSGAELVDHELETEVQDPLRVSTRTARDDASLGLEGIRRVFEAHGAELTKRRLDTRDPSLESVWLHFEIYFPAKEVVS
jgi:PAS domain-containing protein